MSRVISMVILCGLLLAILSGCSGGGESAGPVATTVWQQVNAPEGGIISALAVDPANHLTIYAATNNSGIFKSTNGGASWSPVNSGLARMQVYCIAIDPNNSQIIYAGTDYGLYKSTDAAASWSEVNSGLYQLQYIPDAVLSISIDSTDSRKIFAGCGGGIYKTSNAGESWNRVYSGLLIPSVAVTPGNGQIIYAGTTTIYGSDSGRTASDLGILKSSDGGSTWQTVRNDTGYVRSIVIDATNSIVYACTGHGFFKSTDGGSSWESVFGFASTAATSAPGSQTMYVLVGNSLSSSTDGGDNWIELGTPLAGMQAISLAIDPQSRQTIYAGTYGAGVFKSLDGGVSWSAVNTGLTATAMNAAVIAGPDGMQNIFVGTQSGIFKSTDAGASWRVTNSHQPDVTSLAVDPRSAQTLYAGRDFAGVSKTGNDGESWSGVNEGLRFAFPDSTAFYYPSTKSLAIDPADGTIYAGTDDGVYKSSNGGGSWSFSGTGLTGNIPALAIDPVHKGAVYAGTYGGVFKSVDGGTFWKAMNSGLPVSEAYYSLVIDPSDTQILYAGSSSGVYSSTNGGNSWTVIRPRSMVYPVTALAIDAITRTVYAGTRGALYKTTDSGNTWSLVSIPVGSNGDITAIAIKGTTLIAVTNAGAVFRGSTMWQ